MRAVQMIARTAYDRYGGDKARLIDDLVQKVLAQNPDALTIEVAAWSPDPVLYERPEHRAARRP